MSCAVVSLVYQHVQSSVGGRGESVVEGLSPTAPCSRCQGCPSARSPLTLPPWMSPQVTHRHPAAQLHSGAIVRSRTCSSILLLLLGFSLNTNTRIPTSEECPAVPLYPYESQAPKLRCAWVCLGQFMYLCFSLKAGLVLFISFCKGAC